MTRLREVKVVYTAQMLSDSIFTRAETPRRLLKILEDHHIALHTCILKRNERFISSKELLQYAQDDADREYIDLQITKLAVKKD
jgi:hypothetical protein